jgi:hypothetical protein
MAWVGGWVGGCVGVRVVGWVRHPPPCAHLLRVRIRVVEENGGVPHWLFPVVLQVVPGEVHGGEKFTVSTASR